MDRHALPRGPESCPRSSTLIRQAVPVTHGPSSWLPIVPLPAAGPRLEHQPSRQQTL